MINKKTILNLVSKIASKIQPDRIYLIGSYANGHANEDSDIDLLIIKDTTEPKYKRSIEIQRILKGSKLPVDIVVYTNDEFENERQKKYSFVNTAIQDAQLMYKNRY